MLNRVDCGRGRAEVAGLVGLGWGGERGCWVGASVSIFKRYLMGRGGGDGRRGGRREEVWARQGKW